MSNPFSGLPDELAQALEGRGFADLTSVQKAVAESDSQTADLRVLSQTGSGKTVAVGIAIARELLALGPRAAHGSPPTAIVLTPTRELAMQVQRELAWLFAKVPDASVEVVTGGTSVFGEKKALQRGPRVIVGTPGRTLDHLKTGNLIGDNVEVVVLDEADQMLDMGFRDELQGILDKLPNRRRTHLVSATFANEVLAVAQRYQTNPVRLEGDPIGVANADIEHIAHVVAYKHSYDALVNILLLSQGRQEDVNGGRILVFTRTRIDTIEVSDRLQKDGFTAEPLSGDLAQAQRTRTLSLFRSGRVSILVATDVAARGLDVQGIDMVVHLDPPTDPDSFTHRSGRTGRAGKKGISVLLLPPQARRRVERLLQDANVRPNWAPLPTADKIEKAFLKLGRRRVYTAIEEEPSEERLAYAAKLLETTPPDKLVAALMSLVDLKPPCLPREVSSGFSPEHPGHAKPRPEGRRDFGPRPRHDGPPRDDRGPFPRRDAPQDDRPIPGQQRFSPAPRFDRGPSAAPSEAGARNFGAGPRFERPAAEGGAPAAGGFPRRDRDGAAPAGAPPRDARAPHAGFRGVGPRKPRAEFTPGQSGPHEPRPTFGKFKKKPRRADG